MQQELTHGVLGGRDNSNPQLEAKTVLNKHDNRQVTTSDNSDN